MSLNFANVVGIAIPQGNVAVMAIGATPIWEQMDQLAAPSISRDVTELSLTDNDGNAASFKLYDGSILLTTIPKGGN